MHCQTQLLLDLFEELTAGQILQQEVQAGLILERLYQSAEEPLLRVLTQRSHDIPLVHDVLNVFLTPDPVFFEFFEGEELTVELVPHK